MFLSYPNNPTSAIANDEYFDRAIAFAQGARPAARPRQRVLRDRLRRLRRAELPERPGAKDVAIELFSASKAYNMTGWRVAFACGNAQAIKALGTVKSNIDSGVFTAVQDAAIEAFARPAGRHRRAVRAVPAPSRPRLRRARQDRYRGPLQARGHDLRLGEGPGGLHLGSLRREGPRGGQRHRGCRLRVRSERRRLHPHLADYARRPSRRGHRAHRELPLGGISRRGTAPPPRNRRRPAGPTRTRGPRRRRPRHPDWPLEESLAELERLADTAGAEVVATVTQKLDRPHPRTFIGTGKAEEVAELVRDLDATLVIFDDDLTPSQQANLENLIA